MNSDIEKFRRRQKNPIRTVICKEINYQRSKMITNLFSSEEIYKFKIWYDYHNSIRTRISHPFQFEIIITTHRKHADEGWSARSIMSVRGWLSKIVISKGIQSTWVTNRYFSINCIGEDGINLKRQPPELQCFIYCCSSTI